MKKANVIQVSDPLVSGAKSHFQAAAAALRTGCAEALITGLHLISLHKRSNAQGSRNDTLLAKGDPQGFDAALAEIGIPKPTAYRWMNACRYAAVRATLLFEDEDINEAMPDYGDPKWAGWERSMSETAEGMSLNRLLLGASKASTEDHRYDELISADEEGRQRASELLQGVAEGRYTLVQAVKALGSLEAYDKLRAEGGEKVRKDPVYLDYDAVEKRSVGLIPKAFTTLHNGFQHWESYDPDARSEMGRMFTEVIKSAPKELTALLRK